MGKPNTASVTGTLRLRQDYLRIIRDPIPFITAAPLPSDLFEWHYVIRGPDGSPYKGGFYHGKLMFPEQFPFRPPSIYMITPSGRFSCNTRLCLSISDFHPDTWNPAWSVSSILTGLLSFMLENTHTMGSIESTPSIKRSLARSSGEFNLKSSIFRELFPEIVQEIEDSLASQKEQKSTSTNEATVNPIYTEHQIRRNQNAWHVSSLFVLLLFSMFVFLVNMVIRVALETT